MNFEISNQVVDTVFKVLIDGSKQDYIGEKISQLEHSLQAAAQALETSKVFLFYYDYYLYNNVGVTGHERIGAEYLRKLGFSNKVAQLVESHVPVKRYLTGKDHSYYESLSGASKLSLKYQGGPFTSEQVKEFEEDPLFELKVQVRKWDDAAKVVGLEVPDLESYRQMAVNHLMKQDKVATALA
ncbi:hypothetical protein INT45_010906 [Circinella minor]|uniref:Uncharacterized protein n=1 Tax=Circinella minor TaxID=1195481 RepID=A0A8H7RZM9_9FUNG|nr:hypothetical protein INT45_010906 [Circinella minor]